MIDLYIEGQHIDLTDDIIIDMNYTAVDISQPTAIKNSFSKTISIPGTKNNNDVFGNIFRFDRNLLESTTSLIGVNFDARKRVSFQINRNGGIIERGYLQMNDILINDNKNIVYNVTLYGGLGDFFYNLMYNEDGETKTLVDIYYKWKPVYTKDDTQSVFTSEQEKSVNLITWNPKVIARSYSEITSEDTGNDEDYITQDITAIPVYQGKYNDFKSDTLAINTASFNNSSSLPSNYLENLQTLFPDSISITDESTTTTYNTITDKDISSAKWAILKLQRDIEPFEARDLRVKEMNVGLKLSRLLNRISDPVNNGGYNVYWDDEIKNSPYWKYSWILLDKPDWTLTGGSNNGQLDGSADSYITWQNSPYDISNYNNAILYLNYQPKFTFQFSGINNAITWSEAKSPVQCFKLGNAYYWNFLVTVFDIYDGNNLISTYNLLTSTYSTGYDPTTGTQIIPAATIYAALQNGMSSLYSVTISAWNAFNIKNLTILEDSSTISRNTGPQGQTIIRYSLNYVASYDNYSLEIPVSNTIENLKVRVRNYPIQYKYENGTGSVNNGTNYYFGTLNSSNTTITMNNIGPQPVAVNYLLNEDKPNCVGEYGEEIVIDWTANKQVLLGSSESPFKYLTDFAKILNLKFEYDKVNNEINITLRKNYYQNNVIDLSNDIDWSKQVKVDPTITTTKYKELALQNIDSYPNYLYSKKYIQDYASYKFNTKYEFNSDIDNLFKDNIYKELIPYHLSSQYLIDTKGYPSILAAGSFEYTLYKDGTIGGDENTSTVSVTSNPTPYPFRTNIISDDIVPKLACFNKELQYLPDCKNSFVFFNGFYKNFDYVETSEGSGTYIIIPKTFLTESPRTVNEIVGQDCYIWSLDYSYDTTGTNYRKYIESPYSVGMFVLPYFSKLHYNSMNEYYDSWNIGDEYTASWNISIPNQIFNNENNIPFMTQNTNRIISGSPTGYDQTIYVNISSEVNNVYIYNQFWEDELNDIYDKNGKTVTLYCRLNIQPSEALKQFYFFEGCYWIISKIENYNAGADTLNDFHKITFIKVKNISNYIS